MAVHKILRRDILPNGTKIQLEDWSPCNTKEYPNLYGYTIGAYPIAKGNSYWIRAGKTFRLSISHNSYADYTGDKILQDYNDLLNGDKTLEDLAEHYDDREKARYYMGLSQ
jgi:hypothetical protein